MGFEDELAVLNVPTPAGKSPLQVPPPNAMFVYAVGRAMSFWPVINGNNATWLEEEIAKLYQNDVDTNLTFKSKLVNIDHEIGPDTKRIVIGAVINERYIPGVGVDVLNQLDRRQLEAYDIAPEEFAANGEYSKQSVEINCDRSKSKYIVITNPSSVRLEDQRIFSAEEASALGIRRTMVNDPQGPYYFDGKFKVVEAGIPNRVRGIAMLNNPADLTSEVFDIAASHSGNGDDMLDDISPHYANTEPMSLSNDNLSSLSDNAFAVVQGNVEAASTASIKSRELPLYLSNEALANKSPHAGLIKAAVDALGATKGNRERRYPKSVHADATQKVRSAHDQLTGEKSMAITAEEKAAIVDPLDAEIASLREKIATATAAKTIVEERVSLKDTEIASLKETIQAKDTEIAALVAKIADAGSAEVAATRLAELAKIDGFAIKDEEKASLVEALKTESEDQFKLRLMTEENAALKRKIDAGVTGKTPEKTADELAADAQLLADEHAGMKIVVGADGKKVSVAKSPYDALFS